MLLLCIISAHIFDKTFLDKFPSTLLGRVKGVSQVAETLDLRLLRYESVPNLNPVCSIHCSSRPEENVYELIMNVHNKSLLSS